MNKAKGIIVESILLKDDQEKPKRTLILARIVGTIKQGDTLQIRDSIGSKILWTGGIVGSLKKFKDEVLELTVTTPKEFIDGVGIEIFNERLDRETLLKPGNIIEVI